MTQGTGKDKTTTQVVDFMEARNQKMDEKRRKTERIFFKNLLNVYCVMGEKELKPIELIEMSEDGCSFQVPFEESRPWPTDSAQELTIRLYFSQDTYIPVVIRIANSRPSIDNGVRFVRYGCAVDKTLSTYPAFVQFVKFLKLYSEHAHQDVKGGSVFYI